MARGSAEGGHDGLFSNENQGHRGKRLNLVALSMSEPYPVVAGDYVSRLTCWATVRTDASRYDLGEVADCSSHFDLDSADRAVCMHGLCMHALLG